MKSDNYLKYTLIVTKHISFFVLLIFISFGCKSKTDVVNIDTLNLNVIKFPIDSATPYSVLSLDYYYDSKNNIEYLFTLNENTNSLQIYDFKTKQKLKDIKYKKHIDGYCVHNLDSIFLIGSQELSIILTDTSGYIKKRWQLSQLIGQYEIYMLNSHRIYYFDNTLHLLMCKASKYPDVYKTSFLGHIDISTDSAFVKKFSLHFSKNNQSGIEYYSFYPAYTLDDKNQMIVSYDVEHDIHVFTMENKDLIYSARSKYITDFFPFDLKNKSKYYNDKYQIEQQRYADIIYDKYRKLYYRIARHGIKYKNDDGSVNSVFDMPWSIIVLDSNLNYLKEIYCPSKEFRCPDIILTKDGLLISNNNEYNKDFSKNYLSFKVFRLVYENN